MNKLLKNLIAAMLFYSISAAYGQVGYEYTYDSAGNRTQRMIIIMKNTDSDSSNYNRANLEENTIVDVGNDIVYNIFPNPTQGLINIEISGLFSGNLIFQLYDIKGRNIYNVSSNNNRVLIDIRNQPNGMYILRNIYDGQIKEWEIIKN